MAQFTIYQATDAGGPGYINGLTGSLIKVLDAVLVNGYPGKPAAGWTKPFASNFSGSIAAYQQASGSQRYLYVNDYGPNSTAIGKEAWVCGYETIIGLTGSNVATLSSMTGSNGQGTGQFPLPGQYFNFGHVVWRKSNTADNTPRYWIIAADASTMYIWIAAGDNSTYYRNFGFGDCYSLAGPSDRWKCIVYGRGGENNANDSNIDFTCNFVESLGYTAGNALGGGGLSGFFIDRNAWGSGTSTSFYRLGDNSLGSNQGGSGIVYVTMDGVLASPNCGDNSIYLCPMWVLEGTTLRGRFRGLYQVGHMATNFAEGQTINGGGEYAGKTFRIIRRSADSSLWALEVSDTLETN